MISRRISTTVMYVGMFLAALTAIDVVRAQPGGDVDSSQLTDLCDEEGGSADYSEELSGNGTTMERNVDSETGCPNHVNWAINPNSAREIESDTTIPAYPMLMGSDDTTDLSMTAGAVGIMLNGVSIFSSWAKDMADSYDESAFALEGDTFDLCGGHASPDGHYHYHSTPGCLQEQAMQAAGTDDTGHSPQIGWSYDGFPMYGQLGPDGVEMLMCGNDGANSTYCLDSCSGYEGEVGVDEFKYRYYSSCGFDEAFFPFTTNCFRGCCPDGMTCDANVEECDDDAEDGFTEDYVPAMATDLSTAYSDSDLIDGTDSEYIDTRMYVDCALYLGSAEASNYDFDDSGSTVTSVPSNVLVLMTAVIGTAVLVGLP